VPATVETAPAVVEPVEPAEPVVETAPVAPLPAQLHVTVRSSVRDGRLLLLADGHEVFSTPLETAERGMSRAFNKVVGKATNGVDTLVEVPAGTRELTVRVYSEAKSRWFEERVGVDLAPGSARQVEVVAGRAIGPWLSIRMP
jgi:hypothetical protein